VGFGTYKLTGPEGMKAIKCAIKTGYRLLDTAHVYQNEVEVGKAVRESIEEGVLKSRDEIFITSKLHSAYHNPKRVLGAIEHQVGLLGLDYIDLYLIHAPWGHKPTSATLYDLKTETKENGDPVLEDFDHRAIWAEMEKAVEKGLVRNIGVSNFDIEQVDHLLAGCKIKPLNNQIECHPYLDQNDIIKHHQKHDISVTSFMSLGRGDRTKDGNGVNLFDNPVVEAVAKKYGKSTAQILLRYQLQQGVLIVPKSATPSRITENSELFDFAIDEVDVEAIRSLDLNKRSCQFGPSSASKNFPQSWLKENWYQELHR